MKKKKTLELAKENLADTTGFEVKWTEQNRDMFDAIIHIILGNNRELTFNAEIKEKVSVHQIDEISRRPNEVENFLLVSGSLSPNAKEKLRQSNISYLEANGNLFLNDQISNTLIWIDTNKPLDLKQEKGNRAFTKTGLKVLFHFLVYPDWITLPYRELAKKTGASLGNLSNILNSLEDSGYLIRKNKNELVWNNRKQLLDNWISHYKERLKPSLSMGSFRFLKEENQKDWKKLKLQPGHSWWGGEPAADLLTNYLAPGEWTLYTRESRQDLIKNYKLVPDPQGPVKAFRSFWKFNFPGPVTPPLLVYADLVNTENSRCLETAKIIYQKHLDAGF